MRTKSRAVGLAGLLFLIPCASLSQTPAKLEFEVASVRALGQVPPTALMDGRVTGGPGSSDPERLIYSRMPMQLLIGLAYGIGGDRISGPEWVTMDNQREADRYDITAKVLPGTTQEQAAAMLRNLLANRFRLAVHRMTSEFSGYALVVAKGGAKLRESAGPPAESERAAPVLGKVEIAQDGFPFLFPGLNMGASVKDRVARDRFRDYSLADLADQLTIQLDAHVFDKTGLTGRYDFTLQFEAGLIMGLAAMLPHQPGRAVGISKGPPSPEQQNGVSVISAALERQLGLKLEKTKAPMDVLVIDHVEKIPTEN